MVVVRITKVMTDTVVIMVDSLAVAIVSGALGISDFDECYFCR